jgi:hypothetical protein
LRNSNSESRDQSELDSTKLKWQRSGNKVREERQGGGAYQPGSTLKDIALSNRLKSRVDTPAYFNKFLKFRSGFLTFGRQHVRLLNDTLVKIVAAITPERIIRIDQLAVWTLSTHSTPLPLRQCDSPFTLAG